MADVIAKEFFIVICSNVLFIIIIFILVFVPIENDDFGSTEAIAIVSVIWCFINSLLAFVWLKSKPRNSDLVINKKNDYMHSEEDSQHRNNDENVQILVKNEGNNTTDINDTTIVIELEEIKIKYDKETEKRQQIEDEHTQIREEYEKSKQEIENSKNNNLKLSENCKHLANKNEEYKQQIYDLQIVMNEYKQQVMNNSTMYTSNGNENYETDNEKINKLKKELAAAQKTIIEMTSVVGVQQKFPTVQETIQQFRSIRDQKHHDTSTLIKKFIRNNITSNQKKWQKYYINQIVHEIMFEILCECYKQLEMYRLQIYDKIANILNMKYAIAKKFEINNGINDITCNPIVQKHQIRLLSNIFGPYFKNNFKFVLQKKLCINNDETKQQDDEDDENNDGDLVSNIIQLIVSKYSQYLTNLNEEETNGLKEYIVECSEVCWVMILQEPALNIQPLKWKSKHDAMYDETYHKRVLGSDRNCKKILYYVWPAVARNNIILGDQKIDVVLRDTLYTPHKQNTVSSSNV